MAPSDKSKSREVIAEPRKLDRLASISSNSDFRSSQESYRKRKAELRAVKEAAAILEMSRMVTAENSRHRKSRRKISIADHTYKKGFEPQIMASKAQISQYMRKVKRMS